MYNEYERRGFTKVDLPILLSTLHNYADGNQMIVNVCGTDRFYMHVDREAGVINIDTEPLDDCYDVETPVEEDEDPADPIPSEMEYRNDPEIDPSLEPVELPAIADKSIIGSICELNINKMTTSAKVEFVLSDGTDEFSPSPRMLEMCFKALPKTATVTKVKVGRDLPSNVVRIWYQDTTFKGDGVD